MRHPRPRGLGLESAGEGNWKRAEGGGGGGRRGLIRPSTEPSSQGGPCRLPRLRALRLPPASRPPGKAPATSPSRALLQTAIAPLSPRSPWSRHGPQRALFFRNPDLKLRQIPGASSASVWPLSLPDARSQGTPVVPISATSPNPFLQTEPVARRSSFWPSQTPSRDSP